MGRDLMVLDSFRESIMRSDAALRPHGIRLFDLLMDAKGDALHNTACSLAGIVCIQVIFHVSHSRNKMFMF